MRCIVTPNDICLVMIVRDEAAVIERALRSAAPYVSDMVIIDTGSQDQTISIIAHMAHVLGIPCTVLDRPWVNFAHNRSELFELAEQHTVRKWLLALDADAVFSGRLPTPFPDTDVLMCDNRLNAVLYPRPTFFRTACKIRWKGILHEYPDLDGLRVHRNPHSDFTTTHLQDGARCNDKDKFKKDAALLESVKDKTPRDVFYLAQSYRDAGDDALAALNYQRRVLMGGWDEEVFCAQLEYAKCQERRRIKMVGSESDGTYFARCDVGSIANAYFEAWQKRVVRAEPLCELARFYRLNENYHWGFICARAATDIKRPFSDVLFIDTSVYDWRSWDELALNAFYIGRHSMAKQIFMYMLDKCALPPEQRKRTENNLEQVL